MPEGLWRATMSLPVVLPTKSVGPRGMGTRLSCPLFSFPMPERGPATCVLKPHGCRWLVMSPQKSSLQPLLVPFLWLPRGPSRHRALGALKALDGYLGAFGGPGRPFVGSLMDPWGPRHRALVRRRSPQCPARRSSTLQSRPSLVHRPPLWPCW